MRIGAGVAIGTIIGGIASVILHFTYNLPRTKTILVSDKEDLVVALFRPIMLVAPILVASYIFAKYSELFLSIWTSIFSISICWFILWKYGLNSKDRAGLYATIEQAVLKRSPQSN